MTGGSPPNRCLGSNISALCGECRVFQRGEISNVQQDNIPGKYTCVEPKSSRMRTIDAPRLGFAGLARTYVIKIEIIVRQWEKEPVSLMPIARALNTRLKT